MPPGFRRIRSTGLPLVHTSVAAISLSLAPRAKNAASAGFDASIGAIQIRRLLTNATRLLSGATCGSSPSPRSFGGPPAIETDHTCILGWLELLAGFGASTTRLDP